MNNKEIERYNSRLITVGMAVLITAFGGLYSPKAEALAFSPTETEWSTWPDYCRARYVVSGAGRNSHFARRVSSAEVELHHTQIGQQAWHWLHHYCAGLVYLERAKASDLSALQKKRLLDEASGQMMGQYQRTSRSNAFFGIVATSIGRVHRESGDTEEALGFVRESISAQPGYTPAYTLGSLIYRENGDLIEAREILLAGDEASNGQSAEIHYFLGLICIELDELDLAVAHAKKAYDLGYPLPGLVTKLKRAGRSLD